MEGWKTGSGILLLLWIAVCAQAQQPAPQMPEVPETVRQFWKRVDRAKTLTYTVKVWMQDTYLHDVYTILPGKYLFHAAHVYEIKAQRPNRLWIRCTPSTSEYELFANGTRQKIFENWENDLYINDGRRSISLNAHLHIYTLGPGLPTLDPGKMTNEEKVKSLIYSREYLELVFDPRHWDGFKLSSDAAFPAENYAVYILEDPMNPDRYQKIYFDRETGQLLQRSEFVKDKSGKWLEAFRWEFRFWDMDAPLPSGTFDTRPPRLYRTPEEYDKEMKKRLEQQKSSKPASKQ